jgi:hypothetical protein
MRGGRPRTVAPTISVDAVGGVGRFELVITN